LVIAGWKIWTEELVKGAHTLIITGRNGIVREQTIPGILCLQGVSEPHGREI
jgi:hypothetical protein